MPKSFLTMVVDIGEKLINKSPITFHVQFEATILKKSSASVLGNTDCPNLNYGS